MTFRDIEHSLPNGFHDASILGFSLNCLERTVALRISVYLAKGQRRIGNLNASAVEMFFVEPPDCTVPFNLDGKGINVSGDAALIGLDSSIECLFESFRLESTATDSSWKTGTRFSILQPTMPNFTGNDVASGIWMRPML